MKRGVYLAGTMFMKEVIAARVREVQALGVHVNSTWPFQTEGATLSEAEMKHIAERDLQELLASELCICDATEKSSSSGYHSEVGAALAAGVTLWVIGDRSKITNVFFRLAFRWFDTWEQAQAALLAKSKLASVSAAHVANDGHPTIGAADEQHSPMTAAEIANLARDPARFEDVFGVEHPRVIYGDDA